MNYHVLIVSGHPDLNGSFANKIILEKTAHLLPQAEIIRLDKMYPDFRIDADTEQQRLLRADIIVLQFPLFWYEVPALMKKWMEDVFTHGFAHGTTGDKLHGKQLVISFTSGAPEDMYRHGAPQNYFIEEFLPPLRQFASLCGMKWGGHVYSGGFSNPGCYDESERERMHSLAVCHAERLSALLSSINS